MPLRVVTFPARTFACLRRSICREPARAGCGLPYAICVVAIYGLSFSKGADLLSAQRERVCSSCEQIGCRNLRVKFCRTSPAAALFFFFFFSSNFGFITQNHPEPVVLQLGAFVTENKISKRVHTLQT